MVDGVKKKAGMGTKEPQNRKLIDDGN